MDCEFKETKLKDWKRVQIQEIQVEDHIRVTSNKYRAPGRKCAHVVVQNINEEGVWVNSYGNKKFPDWRLRPACEYKQQRYYRRENIGENHTGICVRCKEESVSLPYYVCIFCKNNPPKDIP